MTPVVAPVAKFTASVVDTGGKFATDEVETGDKFADDRRQSVVYTSGAPLLANISEFLKNSKWPYCYFQGLGGRWFMKKKPETKNLVPLSL